MSNSTFDATAVPAPYEGVDVGEWQAMVGRGAAAGVLHAESVAHVLRKVELTGDVLVEVHQLLAGLGIAIDEGVDELPDETPPGGVAR